MTLDEYSRYDAVGISELVRRREITPPELAQMALAAIVAVNPTINAVVEIFPERAAGETAAGPATRRAVHAQGHPHPRSGRAYRVRQQACRRPENAQCERTRLAPPASGSRNASTNDDTRTGFQRYHGEFEGWSNTQSMGHKSECRRIEWRIGGDRRSRRRSGGTWQRRRWLNSDSSGVLRTCWTEADTRPCVARAQPWHGPARPRGGARPDAHGARQCCHLGCNARCESRRSLCHCATDETVPEGGRSVCWAPEDCLHKKILDWRGRRPRDRIGGRSNGNPLRRSRS
jgi:hypothetical protein